MCTAVGAKRFVEEAAFIAYNINQWKPVVADYIQSLLLLLFIHRTQRYSYT